MIPIARLLIFCLHELYCLLLSAEDNGNGEDRDDDKSPAEEDSLEDEQLTVLDTDGVFVKVILTDSLSQSQHQN